jgi:hypothetical protein
MGLVTNPFRIGNGEQGIGNSKINNFSWGSIPTLKCIFVLRGVAQKTRRPYFNPILLRMGSLLPVPYSLFPLNRENFSILIKFGLQSLMQLVMGCR